MPMWDDEIDNHYCDRILMFGDDIPCKEAGKPCDLCISQRKYKRDKKLMSEGKPTLMFNPFAILGKKP